MTRQMTEDEAAAVLRPWTRTLMRRCGIRFHTFEDGSTGLLDVPAKYVAAIDALQQAVFLVLIGEGLPPFTAEGPRRRAARAKRGSE